MLAKKIVFMGMPVADILINGPEAGRIINDYHMKIGDRTMMTANQVASLEANLPACDIVAGGSMANTACTISQLCPDIDITFLSACADDNYGQLFKQAINKSGMKLYPNESVGSETSRSYVITDQTGERAIARYMGDTMHELSVQTVLEAIKGADILFLEGELLALEDEYKLWNTMIKTAQEQGVKIGISLFGAEQIRSHREHYLHTIYNHAAYVFGNEEELVELYPDSSFDEAYKKLSQDLYQHAGELLCISSGEKPARLSSKDGVWEKSPMPVEKVVSALGAGDAFMAGLITGLLKGYDYEHALELGHRVAGAVIQQAAPQLENPKELLALAS